MFPRIRVPKKYPGCSDMYLHRRAFRSFSGRPFR
jgi:hypothetical protein